MTDTCVRRGMGIRFGGPQHYFQQEESEEWTGRTGLPIS